MAFTSHIEGRNAKVSIYPDRIEWTRTKWNLLGSRTDTNMVPIRKIEGVTTHHASLVNDSVKVAAGAAGVEFRVPRAKAADIKSTITRLMLES